MRLTWIREGQDASRIANAAFLRGRTGGEQDVRKVPSECPSRWKLDQMTRGSATRDPSGRAACYMSEQGLRKELIAVHPWRTAFQRSAAYSLSEAIPRMEQPPNGKSPPRNAHGKEEPVSSSPSRRSVGYDLSATENWNKMLGAVGQSVAWEASGGAGRDARSGGRLARSGRGSDGPMDLASVAPVAGTREWTL